jgi:hypothetical protein
MLRNPTHPDADAVADDGDDERGEYHSPDGDFSVDLHELHGVHLSLNGWPRPVHEPEWHALERRGLLLVPEPAKRRPISHGKFGLFGAAVRALIDDPASSAMKCGLDRADHHEAFGFAIRAVEVGREQVADLVEMA